MRREERRVKKISGLRGSVQDGRKRRGDGQLLVKLCNTFLIC